MTIPLAKLIKTASDSVEKIFHDTGVIYPMYHSITTKGEHSVFPAPTEFRDKDLSVAMVKALFAITDVERFVYFDEAWILESKENIDLDKINREGLKNHPDRREAVIFSAEARNGEMLTAKRFILRPEVGKAKLSPLKIDDMAGVESSGRMVGMLRR